MLSAVDLCNQFAPWSGPTERQAWSGSKMFDKLMLFLKEYFEKSNADDKKNTLQNQHANGLRDNVVKNGISGGNI